MISHKIDENPRKCDNHLGENTTGTETIRTLSVNCNYITVQSFQSSGEMFCKDDSTTDKGIQRPVEILQTFHNSTSRWDSCVEDSQEPTCSKYTIPWTSPYKEKVSQEKTINVKDTHQCHVRNSDINEVSFTASSQDKKEILPIVYQCHLCSKKVKSSAGF